MVQKVRLLTEGGGLARAGRITIVWFSHEQERPMGCAP